MEVNNGGLKTQTVDFQLLANSGGGGGGGGEWKTNRKKTLKVSGKYLPAKLKLRPGPNVDRFSEYQVNKTPEILLL